MGYASKLNSKGGALIIGGLTFWLMAWFIDMWTHIQTYGVASGAHVHGGDALMRVNIPLTGAPLIVFGLVLLIGSEALMRRGGIPVLVASYLLMMDGLFHAFAFNDHLGNLAAASFFAFVAPAQLAVGLAFPFLSRRYHPAIIFGTVGLLGLYALSRTAPFAPLGWPEPVEVLDGFSKFAEVLLLIAMVAIHKAGQPRVSVPMPAAPAPAAAAEG